MPLLQMTLVVEDTILELRGKIQTAAVDDNIGFEVPERDILAGFDLVRLQLLNDLNAFFHTLSLIHISRAACVSGSFCRMDSRSVRAARKTATSSMATTAGSRYHFVGSGRWAV